MYASKNANVPDGITWLCLLHFRIDNIISEISNYALLLGATCQCIAVKVTCCDALPCNVTLDKQEQTHDVVHKCT